MGDCAMSSDGQLQYMLCMQFVAWLGFYQRLLTNWGPDKMEKQFPDDIFKHILFNENVWMLIKISLKILCKCPINNIPALVQIMAYRRPGDKPLSEPMMVSLLTHICRTLPQWVNLFTEDISFHFIKLDQCHIWLQKMIPMGSVVKHLQGWFKP